MQFLEWSFRVKFRDQLADSDDFTYFHVAHGKGTPDTIGIELQQSKNETKHGEYATYARHDAFEIVKNAIRTNVARCLCIRQIDVAHYV